MGADRIELITRVERRRRWSVEDKLGLVAETRKDDKSVASVAKANGISASLLYSWRRQASRGELVAPADHLGPAFVPISVVDDGGSGMATTSTPLMGERRGLIEIDLGDGRQVRVDRDVNASALRRVLGVLSGR
ncbi:MAG: IS66-like element accessory protein TnpA [Methyloceanibacter sp.]